MNERRTFKSTLTRVISGRPFRYLAVAAALALFVASPLLQAQPATKWEKSIAVSSWTSSGMSTQAQRVLADGRVMIAGSTMNGSFSQVTDTAGVIAGGALVPQPSQVRAIGPFGELFVADGHYPYPFVHPAFVAAKVDGVSGRMLWTATSSVEIDTLLTLEAMALDRRGDVVIAGTLDDRDFFVVKLDGSTGETLWTREWNGGGNDAAREVAIDPNGDVVVAGYSNNDIATLKLRGSDGLILWTNIYNSGGAAEEAVSSLSIDAAGYILISGRAGEEILALKLSAAGTQIWASIHAWPGYPIVIDGVIDGNDDLLVLSRVESAWLLVKFHGGSGNVLWETEKPGVGGEGNPKSLVVDGSGDVYVVGEQLTGATYHGAIMKCDGVTGEEKYFVDHPELKTVVVSVNGSGRPYVSGEATLSPNAPYTRALDPVSGSQYWTSSGSNQIAVDVSPRAPVVDASGNVYVAVNGEFWMLLYKYDSSGTFLWSHYLSSSYYAFAGMALDPAGDILVVSSGSGGSAEAVRVDKLSGATGDPVWVAVWDRPDGWYSDTPAAIVVDGAGNSYVVGRSLDNFNGSNYDLLLVSFASDGSFRWVAPFDALTSDYGSGITIDATGNVVVVGGSDGHALIRKYSSTDGSLLWSSTIDPAHSGFADHVRQFGSSHLAVVGVDYSLEGPRYFVARVDPSNGEAEWLHHEALIYPGSNVPPMFDTAGNPVALIIGSAAGSSKLMKLDAATGAPMWTFQLPPEIEPRETSAAVTIDSSAILVVGASRRLSAPRVTTAHISKVSMVDGTSLWGPVQYESRWTGNSADFIVPLASDFVLVGQRGLETFVARLTEDFGIDKLSKPLPIATCGVFFEYPMIALNGSAPYSWSVFDGSLPPGLSLNSSSGVVDGVPEQAGYWYAVIRATDGVTVADWEVLFSVDDGAPYELVSATVNPVCGGDATELSLAGAFASYLWFPGGETTPTLVTLPQHPTLYGVQLGGTLSCVRRGALDVRVTPTLTLAEIRVDGAPAVCPIGVTTLVALNHGGGRSSYQWGYRTTPGGPTTYIAGALSPRYVLDRDDFPGTGTFYIVYETTPFCGPFMISNEVAINVVDFGSPSGLAVEATSENAITLTWVGASGPSVDHYNIYRANGLCPGTGMTKIGETVGAVTSWVDTTGTPGATYSYTVRAASVGNVCESPATACKSAVPYGTCTLAPSFNGIFFVSPSSCELRLSWPLATSRCPSTSSVTYNVYRSTVSSFVPDASNRIASCVANNLWLDKTAQGGTTQYYIVRAEDGTAGGNGPCNHGNEDGNLVRLSGNPAAAVGTETVLLSDNFESGQRPPGADALWFEQALAGGDQLSIVTCQSAGSGVASYHWGQVDGCTGTYAGSSESRLTLGGDPSVPGTGIAIPVGKTARLRFRHLVRTEGGYDGATLYYKTDLMGSFVSVGSNVVASAPYIVRGPYNGVAWSPTRSAWGGTSQLIPFYEVWVNLDGVAGRTVWFQWLFTSDPGTNYEGYYLDDVVVETTVPAACDAGPPPVAAVSTLVRGTTTKVEWVNPLSAQYGATLVRYSNSGTCCPPTTPTSEVFAALKVGTAGGKDSHTLTTRTNGYPMGIFVDDGTSRYSRPKIVIAGNGFPSAAKWVFQTNASAMTPPGIIGGAGGKTFVVSNDRVFHSLNNGLTGGEWPTAWTPPVFDAPSQSRTLALDLPIGGSTRKVVLVGTQNGYVYCVDATTGAIIWTSPLLGDVVQGSPSAISSVYGAPFSLVLAGARTIDGTGRVYGLDPEDGSIRWTFENLVGQGGDGLAVGAINDAINFSYTDAGGGKRRAWFGSRRKSGGSQDTLWALAFDASSVTKLWSRDVGPIDGFPIQGGTTLYAGTNASKVWAVDAVTGVPVWASPFDASDGPIKVTVWPDTANARIYFSTTNHVWSIGTDGLVRWKKPMTAPSTPNRSGSTLLLGSGDGRIYQLGNLLVTDQAQLTVKSIFLAGGYVGGVTYDKTNSLAYVGTTQGQIFAVPIPIP